MMSDLLESYAWVSILQSSSRTWLRPHSCQPLWTYGKRTI